MQVAVSLADLISAGLLKPPVDLHRTYRDKQLTATVLSNGNVRVKTGEFPSLSTAAVEAIRAATGIERSINGWDFWLVTEGGSDVPLAVVRARFKPAPPAGSSSRAKA